MLKIKKLYIRTSLLVIAVFCIWSVILDFSRFSDMDYTYDIFPSAILKRINVVLAILLAFAAGRDGLGKKDGRRMKAALVSACLGEALFALRYMPAGVMMFAICQTLLIIRNGKGLGVRLRNAGGRQRMVLASAGGMLLCVLAVFPALAGMLSVSGGVFIVVYLYGILLCISLWTAIASLVLSLLPEINSKMAAGGMVCFFLCDVLVGLDAALEPGLPWLLANSFIWVFYIPALTLLALSCYRY